MALPMAFALSFLLCIMILQSTAAQASPVYFEEVDSWQPDTRTQEAIDKAHQQIRDEAGLYVCFILGMYNFENEQKYRSLDQERCDGFLFMLPERMEYHSRDFDYEHTGLGFDAADDVWGSSYKLSELDFVQDARPDNLQALRVRAFAERLIQKSNHPNFYWLREIYEEATEEYVLQALLNYSIAMILGLVPVTIYLVYRLLTRKLSIGWKVHFLVAVLLPLILLFAYLPILDSFYEPLESNAYSLMPILGLAYSFCGFLATFLLGQRLLGLSDKPPYWAIFLIYLLAPIALLAAGAAKGAIASAATGGSSGSSGKGSGGDIKGGGGTFGGGGASGGW